MDTTERDDTTLPGRDRRARKTIKLGDTRVVKDAQAAKWRVWIQQARGRVVARRPGAKR